MVKPVPEGYHAVTPYLIVSDAGKAIEFYKRGLGAQEIMRMPGPGGRIMHAEVKIGDSIVMLGEEPPDKPTLRAPQSAGMQTAILYLERIGHLTDHAAHLANAPPEVHGRP